MEKNIAVLLTCFNRKNKTLDCLHNFYSLDLPDLIGGIEVFLVDDGSTDGTSDAVKTTFPKVQIIEGTGNLFWNQGMRLAWKRAKETMDFDFYLWLNDDVVLKTFALKELLDCYQEGKKASGVPALITGAFQNTKKDLTFSYGGRTEEGEVIPNGELQDCKYINGNAVLITKAIFNELGSLAPEYTHAMGDFDYGLRALNAGFKNYTTKRYIGYCKVNDEPHWSNPKASLKERLRLFKSPRGLNYNEYIMFRKKFWGNKWVVYAFKAYLKVLFPGFYNKLKRN